MADGRGQTPFYVAEEHGRTDVTDWMGRLRGRDAWRGATRRLGECPRGEGHR